MPSDPHKAGRRRFRTIAVGAATAIGAGALIGSVVTDHTTATSTSASNSGTSGTSSSDSGTTSSSNTSSTTLGSSDSGTVHASSGGS